MTKHPDDVANQILAVTKRQKDSLKKLGEFGDTYSDIVQKLLDFWREKHKGVEK